ncbi:hypothetical protein CBR_g481 [Chara braunii]|uniref:Uncharacterized protein n=1 Tax=Chara braunii TaxID=69332 RepID=A0A388KBA6_CHABU|nr:hypothetical protein CBR_g481 [Chara braunii]|eukprot:GBG67344.1 hypothetical protein CBR_g481 [Chara braunii]
MNLEKVNLLRLVASESRLCFFFLSATVGDDCYGHDDGDDGDEGDDADEGDEGDDYYDGDEGDGGLQSQQIGLSYRLHPNTTHGH